jgi:two-component system cell cycle sensor histidine kinase/response regulator CckA
MQRKKSANKNVKKDRYYSQGALWPCEILLGKDPYKTGPFFLRIPMSDDIRVLIVEDSPDDAELIARELRRAGFNPEWQRVETEEEYLSCLVAEPEVILADSCLPQFDGLRALDLLQQRGFDIPFLLVSGSVGEDRAVEAMKRGVYDYILKDRLARLGEAVRRALDQRRLRDDSARATEALRRSEEHYRLISEVTADYAYTLRAGANRTLVCEWTTEAFSRITGFTLAEINTRGWNSLYHADDLPIVDRHHSTLISGKADVAEVRTVTKDGDVRWIRIFGRPTPGRDEQRAFRIYGAAQDITANRDLEQQLLHAQKMESIGRLAGGVAHDFNNLLTVISGYGEMLKEGFAAGNPIVENLEPILHAARRAEQLTGQLLAFSRRQVLETKSVNLSAVVGEIEKMFRRVIGEDIEVKTILAPGLGSVQADAGQIEQVIMNLVVNARDAMPGGGRLTIETGNVTLDEAYAHERPGVPPGPYVMLAVGDTGIGMNRETQARIFDPFFTTKEVGKGTGLGLATVYGIVKQSGGNISVRSEPGHGSVFKVYFPRAEHAPEQAAALPSSRAAQGSETILVVEDEASVRKLICGVLRRHGYAVLETGDVDEALRISQEHPGEIGLLLTDTVMPKMSGPQLATAIARLRPGINVIYTSGYPDNAIGARGMLRDAAAFLGKPFSPEALARKVREILDSGAEN